MEKCPKCSTKFTSGTKFCQNCGCKLEEEFIATPTCPKCEKTFPTGTKFCPEDGSRLVSPEKLIPRCVKCGKEYTDGTKFCPKDGGQVISEILINNSNNLIDRITTTSLGQHFLKTSILEKFVFFMGVVAALIDVYIILHFSSFSLGTRFIGVSNAFPLYLKYEVMGSIIFALLLSGGAKLIDEIYLKQEDGSKFTKIGARCATIAGSVSLIFLVLGLLARVITGY